MPLYEYYCTDCRQVFEKLTRPTDDVSPACPLCGGGHLTKMVSTFAAFSASGGQPTPLAGGAGCACGGACACRN